MRCTTGAQCLQKSAPPSRHGSVRSAQPELSEVKALAGLLEEVGDVQADESSFGVAAGSAALARVIIAKMELAEGHAQALLAGHRR